MLFIDTFDPHEPWDAPERFKELYYDDFPCDRFLFGYGVRHDDIKPEDHESIRALYAAEVSFVDMWIGRFLERLDELGLRDNTVVVFTSDHGTHLGEEGCFQKTADLLNSCMTRLPLIVRHPDQGFAGKNIDALVSSVDYMPTFLEMLTVAETPKMDGKNFWSLADGSAESIRDRIYAQCWEFAMVRDLHWHFFQPQRRENPGKGAYLYNLERDPDEKENVVRGHPEVAREMRTHLAARLGMGLPEM